MSAQKIQVLLAKGTELLDKTLTTKDLNELQKAQVVQTLVKVKLQLELEFSEIEDVDLNQNLWGEFEDFANQVDLLTADLELNKVKDDLDNLSDQAIQLIGQQKPKN